MPEDQPKSAPDAEPVSPHDHVAGAHTLLKALQERIGQHPELGEAITRLEMALNSLTLKTGGML
jgi:hypothetical protein